MSYLQGYKNAFLFHVPRAPVAACPHTYTLSAG